MINKSLWQYFKTLPFNAKLAFIKITFFPHIKTSNNVSLWMACVGRIICTVGFNYMLLSLIPVEHDKLLFNISYGWLIFLSCYFNLELTSSALITGMQERQNQLRIETQEAAYKIMADIQNRHLLQRLESQCITNVDVSDPLSLLAASFDIRKQEESTDPLVQVLQGKFIPLDPEF